MFVACNRIRLVPAGKLIVVPGVVAQVVHDPVAGILMFETTVEPFTISWLVLSVLPPFAYLHSRE